jgi:2-polyprenyl-6-methoxyphenol hydroxylase-like FAD-dependent oxidoreductase
MHRGDLHEALASRVPRERIALDKKLVELDWQGDGVNLRFADGTSARADAVVAADGIHSRVRELWLGPRRPTPPAASPTAPRFRRRCSGASPSTNAASGGDRTVTSSSIT